MKPVTCFLCPTPGMSGTTPLKMVQHADGTYECRIGFALFGSANMDEEGFKAANYDPFHALFHDNYHVGKGTTPEEAIENMKKDAASLYESIWY